MGSAGCGKLKAAGFFSVMMFVLLAGCVEKELKPAGDFDEWKVKAEKLKGYTPVEDARIREIASIIKEKEKKKAKEERKTREAEKKKKAAEKVLNKRPLPKMKVSMKMHDVPVDVVIRTLAKAADVNIIISRNIEGTTDLNIDGVPWNQAFESVLRTFGYSYEWIGDIIRVLSIADINNDVGLMEARQSMTLKKREHSLTMMSLDTKAEELEPLETRIIPIRYIGIEDLEPLSVNLWNFISRSGNIGTGAAEEGAEAASEGRLSRGGIMIDKHTHSLMVQATASDIDKLVPIIEKLDQPVLQVLIEAQIVEANKDTARELGVQWGGLGFSTGGQNRWIGGPMGNYDQSLYTTEDQGSPGDADYVPAGSPVTHVPGIGDAINFGIDDIAEKGMNLGMMFEEPGKFMLSVQLQALQQEGKLNILSSPSITTLDNQKALIESGKEVPFQTVEDDEVKIEFKKAVISLDVTPHVISENILKLEIITSKDELDWANKVLGNPTIITKKAETSVVLFDGQTTVIGGLTKSINTDGDAGVPWLKDVPGIGNLFSSSSKSKAMEDLLIFITPHILDSRNFQEVKAQREEEPVSLDPQKN